jgi:BlaI family transcriptional regulator, penicillinase repressor
MQRLSDQEEQAMKILWQLGETNIRAILEKEEMVDTPYTTLASTIKNLEKKGFISSRKIGNVSLFKPIISEVDYKKRFMQRFVAAYFDNSFKKMVNFFVEEEKLNQKELNEIISMIERKKKK